MKDRTERVDVGATVQRLPSPLHFGSGEREVSEWNHKIFGLHRAIAAEPLVVGATPDPQSIVVGGVDEQVLGAQFVGDHFPAMQIGDGKKRKEQKGALTFGYAAPELQTLYSSADTVDPRADLYSVGALMWRMYTGTDPARLADPVSNQFPTLPADRLPPGMEPELRDLVVRVLERDPERRFPSAQEMVKVLDRWVR